MIATSLDVATLEAVVARLRAAGGCDRAVALVEGMRPFDAVGFVMSYLRARGAAPEDDILTMLSAREEEHADRHGEVVYAMGTAPCAVHLLADLVKAGRLRWRDAPGKKGDPSAPLIYSLSAKERRSGALDTRMGCVERAVERRGAAT